MNVLITNDGFKGRGIYIGRPSIYGNPFPTKKSKIRSEKIYSISESLLNYQEYLNTLSESRLLEFYKNLNCLNSVVIDCFCIFDRFINFTDFPQNIECNCHGQILVKTLYLKFGDSGCQ